MKLQQLLNKLMGVRFEETTEALLVEEGFVDTKIEFGGENLKIYEKGDCRVLYDAERDIVVGSYEFN